MKIKHLHSTRSLFHPIPFIVAIITSIGLSACQSTGTAGDGQKAVPRTHQLPERPASFAKGSNPKVAIILMHGKWGEPSGHINPLVRELRARDFWVVAPEMPWSADRQYDASYEDAMLEIDSFVRRLRAGGATKIFVGGHSMGGITSLGYALRHPDAVDGLLLVAPGHTPEAGAFVDATGESTTRAYMMIKRGEGNRKAYFTDLNSGRRTREIYTTAAIYDSWFSVTGPANAIDTQRHIKKAIPQLWVTPDDDVAYPSRNVKLYFNAAPVHPLSRVVAIPGGHLEAPSNSLVVVVEFVRTISGTKP